MRNRLLCLVDLALTLMKVRRCHAIVIWNRPTFQKDLKDRRPAGTS